MQWWLGTSWASSCSACTCTLAGPRRCTRWTWTRSTVRTLRLIVITTHARVFFFCVADREMNRAVLLERTGVHAYILAVKTLCTNSCDTGAAQFLHPVRQLGYALAIAVTAGFVATVLAARAAAAAAAK